MDRFKTLPSVIVSSDGLLFKFSQELPIIIGLAAEKIKEKLEQKEETRTSNIKRIRLITLLLLVAGSILGFWWLQSRPLSEWIPWLVGGTILALLVIALFFLFTPRRDEDHSEFEETAVTYVGLFYWPIGIVPLSDERSLLWDPLTTTDRALKVMPLNANWGLKHLDMVQSRKDAPQTFATLLSFSEGLSQLKPQPLGWRANDPDQSIQELAQEVPDMWQQMVPVAIDKLSAAIPSLSAQDESEADWEQIGEKGTQLYEFYHSMDALRAQVASYRDRAEKLVDTAREVLAQHGEQIDSEVGGHREAYFASPTDKDVKHHVVRDERSLGTTPTAPNEMLLMTPADSQEEIGETLNRYQSVLKPLDEAIMAEEERIKAQEMAQLEEAEQRFIQQRKELDDQKRQLDAIDVEILTLADSLERQQTKIQESVTLIEDGFASLAPLPLDALREQLAQIHLTIDEASALITDVNQKIELEGLELTLTELIEATEQAQVEWQKLAQEMPHQNDEVSGRVDKTISSLTALAEKPEIEEDGLRKVEASVKEVERVARTMVSWSAAQQNPIDAVVDTFNQFEDHLAALREQRQKLEQSSENLRTLNDPHSGREGTLPDTIEELETALTRFTQLSEDTNNGLLAMADAAEKVSKQANTINKLLEDRDALYALYKEKVAAFQEAEIEERQRIRDHSQQRREQLHEQRHQLNRIPETTHQRLSEARREQDLNSSGVIMDLQAASWSNKIVDLMNSAVKAWGQRIAGIDGSGDQNETDENQIERLHQKLEECYEDIRARSVPTSLSAEHHAQGAQLCFVPFWYVETQMQQPTEDKNKIKIPENNENKNENQEGRRVHIFPPLNLKRSLSREMPTINHLRYEELTRRLLTYLRRDFDLTSQQELLSSLSFHPAQLTNAGQQLNLKAAALPLNQMGNALAEQKGFFGSTDPAMTQIIKNTRHQLIPEPQIDNTPWQEPPTQEPKLRLPPSDSPL
ncbi:MAG: hypothetical protein ACPGWR_16645 [Ardenticatenaceae bacterium]